MMIDDPKKNEGHWRFIGEAVPCGISFIIDINDVDVNQFFHFFVLVFRHAHVRTPVGTACGTKKK